MCAELFLLLRTVLEVEGRGVSHTGTDRERERKGERTADDEGT